MSGYDYDSYNNGARHRPHVTIPTPSVNGRLIRTPSANFIPFAYGPPDVSASAQSQQQNQRYNGYDAYGGTTPVRRDSSNSQLLTPQGYTPGQYNNGHPPTYPPAYLDHDRPAGNYQHGFGGRPASFAEGTASSSAFDPDASLFQFPEPELHRSVSQRSSPASPRQPVHRSSNSDSGVAATLNRQSSYSSYASYSPTNEQYPQDSVEVLTDELSQMTLESEEGLRRFQAGELAPADEEWHRLVPEAAREALGKQEVQRQSILFEVFKAEREYVSDLEAVIDVFIGPLRAASVIPGDGKTDEFIDEVFFNLNEVLSPHQRMLGSLFARQRDQHPLIQSVADIILETALAFRPAYESYIKHYPLAEAKHRDELKRNPAYRAFIQEAIHDPRIRKRDLVTFISRPVTRLPRLSLLLENMLKFTDPDHPDQETMPLIISILGDFIKSTQPGIEAAENKVKYFNVTGNLIFRKGEIIDIDDQDASRSLVLSQTLARRQRSEIDWHGWNDYFVILLDHYLMITRELKRPTGSKYEVSSRPIPLEYLRLGQFNQASESRKEKSEEGGLLDNLRFHTRPQYPFTIYHAGAKLQRRYTLFTNTESARRKWYDALVNAIAIRQVRQDSNKWFAPNTLNDNVFRTRTTKVPSTSKELFTGIVTAAAPFVSGGKNFLAVGCAGGIYVGLRGDASFRRVLTFQNAASITALQRHNKILIHADGGLFSYSMDIMARVSQSQSTPQALEASTEKVSGQDTVTLSKVGIVKDRTVVVYTSKGFRQTSIFALEAVANTPSSPRRHPGGSLSYRSFGQPFYVPRQAFDITPLSKTVAIATEKGVTIIDPTNLQSSAVLVVPDFSLASSCDRISSLKSRCEDSKPLGIARVDPSESMVIYEEFACYIDRHGSPARNAAIVRWETKVTSFADRWDHVLLFSPEFVEIRNKTSGRLVQVIEGRDIRLLNTGPPGDQPLILARMGKKNDQHGQSDELLELVKTSEISTPAATALPNSEEYWGEWDM